MTGGRAVYAPAFFMPNNLTHFPALVSHWDNLLLVNDLQGLKLKNIRFNVDTMIEKMNKVFYILFTEGGTI